MQVSDKDSARAARALARAATARRAGRIAAAVAATLAVSKLIAGQLGHSAAVTASALDSLMDVFASSANALAVQASHAAPDRGHPFGHAKIEALATAAQGLLIGGSGVYLLIEGIRRLINPVTLTRAAVTLGTMCAAMVVTLALVVFLERAAKRSGSNAIRADSIHYRTDIFANLAVLIGVAITYATGIERIDAVLTIAVSGYVLFSAFELLRTGTSELLDAGASDEQLANIEGVLERLRGEGHIEGYHGLRTRVAGHMIFVQLHVELPGDMRLSAAHTAGERVRDAIQEAEPDAEVLIHIDVERDE